MPNSDSRMNTIKELCDLLVDLDSQQIEDGAEKAIRLSVVLQAGALSCMARSVSINPIDFTAPMQESLRLLGKLLARREELRTMPYSDYLLTPEWRDKAMRRKMVDCNRCVGCGSREKLQVHHLTYARRGFEGVEELRTLCDACHEGTHRLEGSLQWGRA